jgi:hypothetical protein
MRGHDICNSFSHIRASRARRRASSRDRGRRIPDACVAPVLLWKISSPHLGYPAPIAFWSFNRKRGLPSQRQKVLITAHQHIRSAARGQIQKRLIARIPAHCRASFHHFDHLAMRKILGQQFLCIISGKTEFWVAEDSRELRGGGARDQRHAATFAPMLAEPSQAAIREQERRHNRRRIEDHSAAHAFSRAHATAAVTSSSSIPSWTSRARTSSARLRCSGRRMMHSPSVLTSK